MTASSRLFLVFLAIGAVATASIASAAPSTKFAKLNPKECVPADDTVMSHLPQDWTKYKKFVKVCNLRKDGRISDVSIVSIWEQEYFARLLKQGRTPEAETFPLPVIMTSDFKQLGTLPEVYPDDDVTSQDVFYGKWWGSIPTEIRVDVENPAVGGDYHYEPIMYNRSTARYEMKNTEIVDGRRH